MDSAQRLPLKPADTVASTAPTVPIGRAANSAPTVPIGTATSSAPTVPISAARTPKVRIEYLDSLRGLAALAVVFVHAFEMFGLNLAPVGIISDARLTANLLDKFVPFLYEHVFHRAVYAVPLFIVLSGYSLMLAVARSRDGQPSGGITGYFKRRVRRIWPPYFACLIICLLIIAVLPAMHTKSNGWWDLALPVTTDSIIAHALFVQHLNPEWFFKINPPMWTVSVEEHIYILFPFLLLPFWRRYGSLSMVTIALGVGIGSYFLLPALLNGARPWYLGLFALGGMGASIGFSRRAFEQVWRVRIPWFRLGIVLLVIFLVITEFAGRVGLDSFDLTIVWDVLFGLSVMCLLIHYTETWKAKPDQPRRSFLGVMHNPSLILLGRFSYSLYLMHGPILGIVAVILRSMGLSSWPLYVLIVGIGVPASVFFSYLFYLVFERPFMPLHARQTSVEPVAAVIHP
jgi:peptidoglycan/LPS O-acetylase OafA/YrhL